MSDILSSNQPSIKKEDVNLNDLISSFNPKNGPIDESKEYDQYITGEN